MVKIFRKNPVTGIKDQVITSTTFRLKNEVIIAFAGGTPYSDVPSRFLAQRAMRGLRVPQPDYVSDELYQVCFVTSFRVEKVLSCLYYIKVHKCTIFFLILGNAPVLATRSGWASRLPTVGSDFKDICTRPNSLRVLQIASEWKIPIWKIPFRSWI